MKKVSIPLVITVVLIFSNLFAYGAESEESINTDKFTDTSGHWAEAAIGRLAQKGIVNGLERNKYFPDTYMTRCQFIAVLHRTLNIQIRYFRAPDITEVFKDVGNNCWYATQLYDLVILGIVDDKVLFKPEDALNREEMAHYIMNAYKHKLGRENLKYSNDLEGFKDYSEISSLYKEDVSSAIGFKLILGKDNKCFEPKVAATRAEVAIILDRFMNIINK